MTTPIIDKAPSPCRDLIGTPVQFFGAIWIITGINYLQDYDVARFDTRRRVWQISSIGAGWLSSTHPHVWEITEPAMRGRFQRVVVNAFRLRPLLCPHARNAKAWRRAHYWRGILIRWFRKVQDPLTIRRLAQRPPILIKDWQELAQVPDSATHRLEIDVEGCNGWIEELTANDPRKLGRYLSTHTFYGGNYKASTALLQACGFNVQIANWDA